MTGDNIPLISSGVFALYDLKESSKCKIEGAGH